MAIDLNKQQENLLELKNYLSNIVNSMPSMVIGVDNKGYITLWNDKTVKETGISTEEASSQILTDLFPGISLTKEELINIIQKKKIKYIKEQERLHNNNSIIENIIIYPLISDRNKGAVIRIDNITKEKKMEDQLLQSRKMDAIGQLAGGIAHDMNNMLVGIIGGAQLLQHPNRNLGEEELSFVELIINASQRAGDLTKKLLTFSRKEKPAMTTLNIHHIIDETVAILCRTINKKTIIKFLPSAKNPIINGNITSIQNAIINMGINSDHAMPSGGTIYITTKNVSYNHSYCENSSFDITPGEYVELIFKDEGTGISKENIDKIFEPFFTTKAQGSGTGLGMTTVYNMINTHHGEITIESEIDNGATFNISIPCTSDTLNVQNTKLEDFHGTGTILLVDDEKLILIPIKKTLEDMGFKVITAIDGEKAIEIYKEQFKSIDLIISDMIMPGINGRELFFEVKKINPKSKFVIASGFTKDEDINELKKLGLEAFLQKPYLRSDLKKLLIQLEIFS